MAEIRNFFESDGVKIEIEHAGPVTREPYFGEFMSALRTLTGAVSGEVAQIPADQRPTEFSIEFGLKAIGAGGFAITPPEGGAQFRVNLKWASGETGLLPGGELPALSEGS
jgi:hypothetical protein